MAPNTNPFCLKRFPPLSLLSALNICKMRPLLMERTCGAQGYIWWDHFHSRTLQQIHISKPQSKKQLD